MKSKEIKNTYSYTSVVNTSFSLNGKVTRLVDILFTVNNDKVEFLIAAGKTGDVFILNETSGVLSTTREIVSTCLYFKILFRFYQ